MPGAYLLAMAEDCLHGAGWRVTSARRIKFVNPLSPEQPLEIEAMNGRSGIHVRWSSDDTELAEGTFQVEPVRV